MIDTPYERVYESTVRIYVVLSGDWISSTKSNTLLFQRNVSARPCFLTKLLDDCTIDGQLSEVDETNIKGAATIVYGGEL